jgi:hypothetical protein
MPKHIVDQLIPCEDGGSPILMRVYYNPETLEVNLGKEYVREGNKLVDASLSYDVMCKEDPQLKADMEVMRQDMVAKAEGYCCHKLCERVKH